MPSTRRWAGPPQPLCSSPGPPLSNSPPLPQVGSILTCAPVAMPQQCMQCNVGAAVFLVQCPGSVLYNNLVCLKTLLLRSPGRQCVMHAVRSITRQPTSKGFQLAENHLNMPQNVQASYSAKVLQTIAAVALYLRILANTLFRCNWGCRNRW